MASSLIAVDNLLQRALVTVSSEDLVYTKAGLTDGDGSAPWRELAAGANPYISADMDEANSAGVRGGGFEGASITADGWTDASTAGNSAARDNAFADSGTYSCKLTLAAAGAGKWAKVLETIEDVPTGQRRTVKVALRGDGTVNARAAVFFPETNQYVQSDGTLGVAGAAIAYIASRSTASFATTTLSFTTPTPTDGRSTVSLQLIGIAAEGVATGAAWVDNFRTFPSVGLVAIHGTNAGPLTCAWLASDTGAFAGEETTVATLTIRVRGFYAYVATPSDMRYQRFAFTGTNHERLWVGEALMAQPYVPTDKPGFPLKSIRSLPQIRAGGRPIATACFRQEGIELQWKFSSAANRDEFHAFEARADAKSIWVIPRDDESLMVYGRPQVEWSDSRTALDIWQDASLVVTPQPYPVWVG